MVDFPQFPVIVKLFSLGIVLVVLFYRLITGNNGINIAQWCTLLYQGHCFGISSMTIHA